ncbi:uncharacterized WD repeat-containing protein all2124-like [Corticium candelabrum]|uniref:uncharacterized WD repeat-containing protein all2124-like n=1 Tax=Corticium candelabrum TaxID=121492 RepID=UPI002E26A1FD|nr:uncharacterized WD repeat-containing protein all2124-like [Corticium candelabrum]
MAFKAEQLARLEGHRWQVACLEFSPGGTLLASGAWDKEVRLWDLSSLETAVTLKNQHTCPVTALAWFQPDGSLLATGSADCTTCIWNSTSGQALSTLSEHFGWVLDVCFSGNGSLLATASWDKTVRVWDPATGVLLHTLNGHTKGVFSCHFHPVHTSAVLCTSSDDETIRIWDARVNNKAIKVFVNGHDDGITCCRWSPDASLIASGSSDRKITVWEPRESKPLCQLTGHEDTVKSLAFNPDTDANDFSVLASVGDCTTRLWDPREGKERQLALLAQHQPFREVETVAISPDGSLLATGARDNVVVLSTLGVPHSRALYPGAGKIVHVESFHEGEAGSNPVEQKLWRRYTNRMRLAAGVKDDEFDSAGEVIEEEDSDSTDDDNSHKTAVHHALNSVHKTKRSIQPSKVHKVKQQPKPKSKAKAQTATPLDPGKTTSEGVKERRLRRLRPKSLEDDHRLHFCPDKYVMGSKDVSAGDRVPRGSASVSYKDITLPPPPPPPPEAAVVVGPGEDDSVVLIPPPPLLQSDVTDALVGEGVYTNEDFLPLTQLPPSKMMAEATEEQTEDLYDEIFNVPPPPPALDLDLYDTVDDTVNTVMGYTADDDPLYARVESVRKK